MPLSNTLNHKQLRITIPPPTAAGQDFVYDVTVSEAEMSTQYMIDRNTHTILVSRIPGAYIHRCFTMLNGVVDTTLPCAVHADTALADGSMRTCVTSVSGFNHIVILGDRLQVMCIWKKGDNPLGVSVVNL